MRAHSKWLWLALAAASLTMTGRVQAATPYSHVKPLSEYTASSTFRVDYQASGSEGTVTRVDLWASKDGGSYSNVGTVYDAATPFYFTTSGRGDGRYAFYTVATLSTSDVESKSDTVEAYTTVDTSAPATLDVSKLSINQDPSLVSGEVTGAAGAVEAGTAVEMYADSAMTSLLRSIKATSVGSFGPMAIGGSSVREVWLAARDAAGNRGAAIKLDNNMSYAGALTSFTLTADGGNVVVANFVAPLSAKQFRVQYRYAGGAVWSVDYYTVGTDGTTIRLTGLEAGRAYDVRIAPVDVRLNVGQWSMASVRTVGTKVDAIVLPTEKPVVVAAKTTSVSTSTASTSTATTTTPADQTKVETPASTDTGTPVDSNKTSNEPTVSNTDTNAPAEAADDTNSAANANEETNGSATPWVILAILIVLAGIATGGYFYWFSGPEEVTTAVTPPAEEKKKDEPTQSTDDADKRW